MYNILIKLIIAAALLDLGISFSKMEDCSSRECWAQIQKASRKVTHIDWKPISIFPEEAKRFR
ncbi:MAG: hypothetical protein IPM97_01735 [Bdellovibrionaceae bacterium]|nr:hypothetical protein [Pseudobdellovibrionaceae bacterium]